MSPLRHHHEHCISRMHWQDPPSSHCVSWYCLWSWSPGCLHLDACWCPMQEKDGVLPSWYLPSLLIWKLPPSSLVLSRTRTLQTMCTSQPMALGNRFLLGSQYALLSCAFVLCMGSLPSASQTTQICHEQCLPPSLIDSVTTFLFLCVLYFVGFRSISTPLQLLWSSSCCLHGWRQARGYLTLLLSHCPSSYRKFLLTHKQEWIPPLPSCGSVVESIWLPHIYHSHKDNRPFHSLVTVTKYMKKQGA